MSQHKSGERNGTRLSRRQILISGVGTGIGLNASSGSVVAKDADYKMLTRFANVAVRYEVNREYQGKHADGLPSGDIAGDGYYIPFAGIDIKRRIRNSNTIVYAQSFKTPPVTCFGQERKSSIVVSTVEFAPFETLSIEQPIRQPKVHVDYIDEQLLVNVKNIEKSIAPGKQEEVRLPQQTAVVKKKELTEGRPTGDTIGEVEKISVTPVVEAANYGNTEIKIGEVK